MVAKRIPQRAKLKTPCAENTSLAGFNPVKPREYGTTKEVVARAIDQAGGPSRVMLQFDLGKSIVYGFSDPLAKSCDLSLDRARVLANLGAHALAEDMAACAGGAFMPAMRSGPIPSWAELGSMASVEFGAFAGKLIQAVEDGAVDAGERERLAEDLDAVLRTLMDARARLNAKVSS